MSSTKLQSPDIKSFLFSTGDVVSDFFVSGEYLNHDEDITSSGTRMINMWGDCVTDMITFRCWNRNTYNGMLTIVFIYLPASFTNAAVLGTISNLQTYILPNLHRKPSIYQPFILANLHFAKPSNYQISNLQTYILPNLHRKTFNLPTLHFTKPTFCSNTQNL